MIPITPSNQWIDLTASCPIFRHKEKHLDEVWYARDEFSWGARQHLFFEKPTGMCPKPELLPSWVVRQFKPRIPDPKPQTSKAGTMPTEILEGIFKLLGVIKVEQWRFRGQRREAIMIFG